MIHTKKGNRRRQNDWTNHIDSAIYDLMNGTIPEILHKSMVQSKPLSNIIKRDKEFVIEMAIPGLSKEEIKISIEKDQLIVSANTERPLAEGERYSKNEFDYSKLERKFNLGEKIDQKKIQAKCEHGLLRITLHVKEEVDTTIKVDIQ